MSSILGVLVVLVPRRNIIRLSDPSVQASTQIRMLWGFFILSSASISVRSVRIPVAANGSAVHFPASHPKSLVSCKTAMVSSCCSAFDSSVTIRPLAFAPSVSLNPVERGNSQSVASFVLSKNGGKT
jgi:hypothetical protein